MILRDFLKSSVSPFVPKQKDILSDVLLFWVPPPKRAAPPFGIRMLGGGKAAPKPRFCLRQNACTPQKRRGPEGPLGEQGLMQKISILTVPSKKKDTTYVVSFFLGSAGRWPAPPFGISNARRKRTLPLPRSCLRQKRHPPAPLLLHALPRPGPWQTQFEDPLLRSLVNEKISCVPSGP